MIRVQKKGYGGMEQKITYAIYSCCKSSPWADVVKKLDQELNIKPSYYIGWRDDDIHDIRRAYKSCFYQTIQNAWKGIGFPSLNYKLGLDEKLLRNIAFEELVAIQMMDRLDADGNDFSFSDRKAFFYDLLKYWLVIIDEYDIELVISPSIPHRVFDYALYVAARTKRIEIIMFQMTPFKDSSFIIDDIEHTPSYFKKNLYLSEESIKLREDIEQRISVTKGNYQLAEPDYMQKQQESAKSTCWFSFSMILKKTINIVRHPLILGIDADTYKVKKKLSPSKSKLTKLKSSYIEYKKRQYLKGLKKEYARLCAEVSGKKYVFVALHYQPEETSCPTGGSFSDQQLIIGVLDGFLDDTYEIIVKEHKTQFHADFEGATARTKNFYQNILKISNRVKFVDIEKDPFKLIAGAVATVTISGTIGWESVIRGTPTLVFGRAWYEDMAGVFKIKSKLDLVQSWELILNSKNNIDENKVLDFHKGLQKYLINAEHYSAFSGKVERTAENNCLNIYNGINNHLNKVGFLKRGVTGSD